MTKHMLWVVFFLPIVIAFPAEDGESTDSSGNGSLLILESKLTTLEEFLHAYNIPNLETLSSCRSKHASCPFVKEELLQFVEDLCKMHNYTPHDTARASILKDSATIYSLKLNPRSRTYIVDSNSKLVNEVISSSIIYLLLWTYGSSLQREKVQRFNEFYKVANETFMNYFSNLYDKNEELAVVLNEKRRIDDRFKLINKEIESNLTKQEDQLNTIVRDIQTQNYLLAIKNFLELDDNELLSIIIEKSINEWANMVEKERLLKFIKKLPSRDDRLIGYSAMLKSPYLGFSVFTLEHNYRNIGSSIFTLEQISNKSSQNSPRKNWKDEAVFELKLRERVEEWVSQTALQLEMGLKNAEMIYPNMIQYSNYQAEPFNAHLEEIVERVFEEKNGKSDLEYEEAVEIILAFADNLTQIPQSARVYAKLTKILELNQQQYLKFQPKIAVKVNQLTSMKNYDNTSRDVQKGLEELKEKLQPATDN